MLRVTSWILTATALITTLSGGQDTIRRDLDAMADAEREFAKTATVKGWRDAFLEFFADDAIAVGREVTKAKDGLRKQPSVPFSEFELLWEPRTGDVSGSGDLGWLTGPSTSINHAEGKKPGYGCYLSIWRKQPDGRWRVFIDVGASAPTPVPFAPGFTQIAFGARYAGKDVRFIGNGVDTASFRPRSPADRTRLRRSFGLPDDRPLVLFAARASEKKNLDDVLEITREEFHLVVCGAERGLKRDGLTDLGVVPYARMAELFGCVDAMVHASTGEGFPLAVQEALAAGVPLALLWDPGYAGSLDRSVVAACDTIDALGPAVRALATDEVLRARLSRAGRAWTESKWSWDATVAAYEQLYLDVTNTTRMSAWAS